MEHSVGVALRRFQATDVVLWKFIEAQPSFPQLQAGDVALCMGKAVYKFLASHSIVPKNKSHASNRMKMIPCGEGNLIFTFDPYEGWNDYARRVDIMTDATLALRVQRTGSLKVQYGEYQFVEHYGHIVDRIKDCPNDQFVDISLDLETVGLDEWDPEKWIVSISLTVDEGTADLVYFTKDFQPDRTQPEGMIQRTLWEQLQFILNHPRVKIRGANLKFDCRWIRVKWQMLVTRFVFDCILAGSLLDENRSNSLNILTKIYEPQLGGYDDCVAPHVRVLTSDLRWIPVGDVVAGDKLLGFDEHSGSGKGKRRRMRISEAVSTKRITKPGVRITLSNGVEIECSSDHGFLSPRGTNGGSTLWKRAYQLKVGDRLLQVCSVKDPAQDWDAGYISGLYDGEGYVSYQGGGLTSGISQRPGKVWDKYCEVMEAHGFSGFYAGQKNTDGVMTSKHSGAQTLEILQVFRPRRLLEKECFDGKCIPSGTEKVWITDIKQIGDIEVVSLETSTHTFVAEGIASHNSFNLKYDKSRMDLVPKEDMLGYAGGDTDACQRVSTKVRNDLLQDKQLSRFYVKLLHPASRAFEEMECGGVLVDKDRYEDLRGKLEAELKRCQAEANEILPARLKAKHNWDTSLTKAKVITDFLFSPLGLNLKPLEVTGKTGAPSSAKSHIMKFIDHPDVKEFMDVYSDFLGAKKTLSTYVEGFLKHLRSDGRYHPSYIMHRSDDGGTNCLPADQLVLTEQGYKPIVEVKVGAKVLSHTGYWSEVTDFINNGRKPVFRVIMSDGRSIRATENHPLLTVNGWATVGDLNSGDTVIGYSGEEIWTREAIESEKATFDACTVVSVEYCGVEPTYDITVEGSHSFVAEGLVVHNTGRLSAKDPAIQCVTGETIVWAPDGLHRIDSLVDGVGFIEKKIDLITESGVEETSYTFKKWADALVRVTLRNGIQFRCTPDHPFRVATGEMVQAKDLTPGQQVKNQTHLPDFSRETELPTAGYIDRDKIKDLTLPEKMTGDLAWLIGFWLGEGSICKRLGLIVTATSKPMYQNRVASTFESFGLNPGTRPDRVYVYSNAFYRWWTEVLGLGEKSYAHTKTVPEFMMSDKHLKSLIRGLMDADGSVHIAKSGHRGKRLVLSFSSNSRYLIEQVQQAVLAFGFGAGSVGVDKRTENYLLQWSTKQALPLLNFLEIEHDFEGDVRSGGRSPSLGYQVKSVVPCEGDYVYDVTVPGSHTFTPNGVVTSNTVPKHTKWAKALRACYIAPPGYKCFEVDFSQGELRIAACVANEPTMIKYYLQGMDLHLVAACNAMGISIEEVLQMKGTDNVILDSHGVPQTFKSIRQNGKAANFGLIYGMSADGYQIYAEDSYGVKLTSAQCHAQRNAFFDLYSRLGPWHDSYKGLARQQGFIRSPLGRVRHLPLIRHPSSEIRSKEERRAINAPVQSTLSDLTQYSLVKFQEYYGFGTTNPEVQFAMMTHDSLSGYVREDKAEEWLGKLVELMSNLPLEQEFGWRPQVPFVAEAELGDDMATLEEIEV